MLIEGAAGIGKTALLDEVRQASAADAFTVLRASGAELERELAFGVVRQLFEPLDARPDERARRDARWRGSARRAGVARADPAPAPEAVHAAMHGLYWLAAELAARGPLLLMVDDAYWSTSRRSDGWPISPAGSTASRCCL